VQFIHHDLGYQPAGAVVVVTLSGTEANVQLLDETNFRSYERGDTHHYYGGHFRQSPVRLTIPSNGHWHVAVDLGGFGGQVNSSARVPSPSKV